MERDKQIEEMAKDLCHTETCEAKKIGTPCYQRCKCSLFQRKLQHYVLLILLQLQDCRRCFLQID